MMVVIKEKLTINTQYSYTTSANVRTKERIYYTKYIHKPLGNVIMAKVHPPRKDPKGNPSILVLPIDFLTVEKLDLKAQTSSEPKIFDLGHIPSTLEPCDIGPYS
ncbi:MAG: Phosphoglycerate kinase [Streblomastix strix]|uniref:Phosphoglycerate kinase n=1 Tax=Streblomastix strix TaxID=222440 RepID=A0A5J4VK79_9EUKA|nr:MAG: Phosphoglycerate kinase [Streblomastix strix]